MLRTVQLPLWLLLLILAFAAVTFASHFLFPSVRWFFRRRMERVVARLNTRLARPIEPFKLARRFDTIQRLIYDPEVARAIVEHAGREGIPEAVAFQKARALRARDRAVVFGQRLFRRRHKAGALAEPGAVPGAAGAFLGSRTGAISIRRRRWSS